MLTNVLQGVEVGSKILGGLSSVFGKKTKRKSPEQVRYEQGQYQQQGLNREMLKKVMDFSSADEINSSLDSVEARLGRLLDIGNRMTLGSFGRSGVPSKDTNFGRKLDETQSRILTPVLEQASQALAGAKERDLLIKMNALQRLGPGTMPLLPEGEPIDQTPAYRMLGEGVDQLQQMMKSSPKKPEPYSGPSKKDKGKPRRLVLDL